MLPYPSLFPSIIQHAGCMLISQNLILTYRSDILIKRGGSSSFVDCVNHKMLFLKSKPSMKKKVAGLPRVNYILNRVTSVQITYSFETQRRWLTCHLLLRTISNWMHHFGIDQPCQLLNHINKRQKLFRSLKNYN